MKTLISSSVVLVIVVVSLFLFCGCLKKKPTACFTLSSSSVVRGESITLTNCSANADAYSWDCGDGVPRKTKNVQTSFETSGVKNITLTATSSGIKSKEDKITQSLTVVEKGKVMFYTHQSTLPITVTLNGKTSKILVEEGGVPFDCENEYNTRASFELAVGTYAYSAVNSIGNVYSGTVVITPYGCTLQLIH